MQQKIRPMLSFAIGRRLGACLCGTIAVTCVIVLFQWTSIQDHIQYLLIDITQATTKDYEVNYLINPSTLCEVNTTPGQKLVLIIVPSKVNYLTERKTIRSTWAMNTPPNVRVAFLLGRDKDPEITKTVQQESQLYEDVIQADFLDAYRNLTLKSLTMLKWTMDYCPNAEFLLKCDDDVYVNIPNLIRWISSIDEKDFLFGRHIFELAVVRDLESRWYVSNETYSRSKWPMYLQGPSYVIRTSIISRLLHVCVDYANIPIEDAVITGVCAEQLSIHRKNVKGFLKYSREVKSRCLRNVITRDSVTPEEMLALHDRLNKCNNLTQGKSDTSGTETSTSYIQHKFNAKQ